MDYPIGLTCQELVELVTEYLDGSLTEDVRERFELHLGICPGCVDYLEQIRATVHAMGRLREDALQPEVRDELLKAFRTWRVTDRHLADTERA